MIFLLLFALLWSSSCFSWVMQEGFYPFKSKAEAYKFISHYLTVEGSIYSEYTWIQGKYPYQLLWLERGYGALESLLSDETRVVVLCGQDFPRLEGKGYRLLTHLEEDGNHLAIYLNNSIFNAWMYVASFDPRNGQEVLPSIPPSDFVSYLKPAANKSDGHSLGPIDFIYMINLDGRPEKYGLSLSKLAPYNVVPYRFSAVNGWDLSQETFDALGVRFTQLPEWHPLIASLHKGGGFHWDFVSDLETTYYHYGVTPGAVGILLSHLSILYDAYLSGYKIIWVMEDDIEVHGDPTRISDYIEELTYFDPSWDILFTDPDTKDKKGNYVPCRSLALRPNYPMSPLSHYLAQFYDLSQNIASTGMRFGAYSMLLSRSGIEKILEFYKQYGFYLPYDMDFWLIPDLRMYTLKEDLISTIPDAISDNGSSDLSKAASPEPIPG